MRVLVAGGVFRLSEAQRRQRQPAPEVTLVEGLHRAGVDAVAVPLEERRFIARARGFDLVHVHHLSKAAVAATLSPAARPLVFTEHQSGPASLRNHRLAQRLVLKAATAVVCLSETEARVKTQDYGDFGGRLRVIRNGIELPATAMLKRSWRPGEPFTALYVGQLIDWKQIDRAIRALPHLPETVQLRLCYHNDLLLPSLQALTSDLGLEHRVTFVGQKSGEALIAEYLDAHVLVLPSGSAEALPSVVTEALETGLPVIGSDVGAVAEQVAAGGLVISPDPHEDLTSPLQTMMDSYPYFAATARERAVAVRDTYTIERMVSGHIDLYTELLAQR